jgi:hypothetical protein
VFGVGYKGYGEVATRDWSDVHVLSGTSKGKALATVSIGSIVKYDRKNFLKSGEGKVEEILDEGKIHEEIDGLKKNVALLCPNLDEESKKLVGEVFVVFAMSHLFTAGIVDKFSAVIQNMCKILEVNMENMKKIKNNLSTDDYVTLYGPTANAERLREANKRADEASKRADNEKEKADKLAKELLKCKAELVYLKVHTNPASRESLSKEDASLLAEYEKQLSGRKVLTSVEKKSGLDRKDESNSQEETAESSPSSSAQKK